MFVNLFFIFVNDSPHSAPPPLPPPTAPQHAHSHGPKIYDSLTKTFVIRL